MLQYAPATLTFTTQATAPSTTEWWVVVALAVALAFLGGVGAWCWFVCNGNVQSCEADWTNGVARAHCR
jgi:hypothetical protein